MEIMKKVEAYIAMNNWYLNKSIVNEDVYGDLKNQRIKKLITTDCIKI